MRREEHAGANGTVLIAGPAPASMSNAAGLPYICCKHAPHLLQLGSCGMGHRCAASIVRVAAGGKLYQASQESTQGSDISAAHALRRLPLGESGCSAAAIGMLPPSMDSRECRGSCTTAMPQPATPSHKLLQTADVCRC